MPVTNHMGDFEGKINPLHDRRKIDIQTARQLLSYCPDSGALYWRSRRIELFESPRIGKGWNTKYAGKIATSVGAGGYLYVCIWNERFLAHRIAWAIYYGEQPPYILDHKNRDRADFRIQNLRGVDWAENAKNQSLRIDNKTGLSGIWRLKPKKSGKPWAVAIGGKAKMKYKRHQNFCFALKHRNQILAEEGFTKTHGGIHR